MISGSKELLGTKTTAVFSLLGVITLVVFFGYILPNDVEEQQENEMKLSEAIDDVDRIVNKAIVHCETDGLACNEIMSQWLERCKNPEMKDIPSCHDGRIEQLIQNPIMMSDECRELKKILNQNRYGSNNNDPLAIARYGVAMDDYSKLGCP